MPIFALDERMIFPDPLLASGDGLLAVGGDLSPERVLLAYAQGIFPWYDETTPILWWSPDPRLILYPADFKISKSLKQTIRKGHFSVSADTCFEEVIRYCAAVPREEGDGTWITDEMKEAYIYLHKMGYAHSVEVLEDGKLAGGLYGISLGKAFFGESMFHLKADASKIATLYLVELAKKLDFHFIDAQVPTDHLKSLGAIEISRAEYLIQLEEAMKLTTVEGSWEGLV